MARLPERVSQAPSAAVLNFSLRTFDVPGDFRDTCWPRATCPAVRGSAAARAQGSMPEGGPQKSIALTNKLTSKLACASLLRQEP
eukprot:3043607-Prymnesium_polylepis.1